MDASLRTDLGVRLCEGGHKGEGLVGLGILALEQQSLGLIALPAVGGIQRVGEFFAIQFIESRKRSQLGFLGEYFPDSAAVVAGTEIHAALHGGRNPFGMLNDEPVHIGDIQCTIRAGLQLCGAKPVVSAGKEFTICFVLGALTAEADALGDEHFAMYKVMHRFADEHAAFKIFTKQPVTIRLRAAGTGDVTVGAGHVGAFHARADGEEAVIGKHITSHAGRGEVRVARKVVNGNVVMPHPVRVVVAEPIAPVIAPAAKLCLACDGFELAGDFKAEIESVDVHAFAGGLAGNRAAAVAVGGVDPVVQPERKTVHAMLLVALAKTREEHTPDIGLPITGGVLSIKDVGCGTNEDALTPCEDAVGEVEPIEEQGGFLIVSIAVSILQPADYATGFTVDP